MEVSQSLVILVYLQDVENVKLWNLYLDELRKCDKKDGASFYHNILDSFLGNDQVWSFVKASTKIMKISSGKEAVNVRRFDLFMPTLSCSRGAIEYAKMSSRCCNLVTSSSTLP